MAVHLGFGVVLFGSASGSLTASPEGGADQGAMTVTLVSAASLSSPPADSAGGALRPLMARVETAQAPVIAMDAPPTKSMNRLLQRLSADQPAQPQLREEHRRETQIPVSAAAGRDEADIRAKGDRGSATGADAPRPGSTGGLWGAVQPCWRRLAVPVAVPVTLDVTLDARGKLSAPPRIIRGGGPVDEPRLRAEASALSALAACLPRGDLRFAGRTHRLEFLPRS